MLYILYYIYYNRSSHRGKIFKYLFYLARKVSFEKFPGADFSPRTDTKFSRELIILPKWPKNYGKINISICSWQFFDFQERPFAQNFKFYLFWSLFSFPGGSSCYKNRPEISRRDICLEQIFQLPLLVAACHLKITEIIIPDQNLCEFYLQPLKRDGLNISG